MTDEPMNDSPNSPCVSTRELSEWLDERLPSGSRTVLKRHIAACTTCREEWQGLVASKALAEEASTLTVSKDFREVLWQRIESGEAAPHTHTAANHRPSPWINMGWAALGAATAAAAFLIWFNPTEGAATPATDSIESATTSEPASPSVAVVADGQLRERTEATDRATRESDSLNASMHAMLSNRVALQVQSAGLGTNTVNPQGGIVHDYQRLTARNFAYINACTIRDEVQSLLAQAPQVRAAAAGGADRFRAATTSFRPGVARLRASGLVLLELSRDNHISIAQEAFSALNLATYVFPDAVDGVVKSADAASFNNRVEPLLHQLQELHRLPQQLHVRMVDDEQTQRMFLADFNRMLQNNSGLLRGVEVVHLDDQVTLCQMGVPMLGLPIFFRHATRAYAPAPESSYDPCANNFSNVVEPLDTQLQLCTVPASTNFMPGPTAAPQDRR